MASTRGSGIQATRFLRRPRDLSLGLAAVLILISVLAFPSPAAAATLHVTDADDGLSPAATLRNQIAAAASGDTVVIDAGVNPTINFGEIAINKNLTIRGQGAGQTVISADETSRIFNIGSVAPGSTVAIDQLMITAAKEVSGAPGGAILNSAALTISNSILAGNATAPGGNGADGGAISNSGTLAITKSTLFGNATGAGRNGSEDVFGGNGGDGGRGGDGGAISNSGTLTITNSTLSGNATGHGGKGGDTCCSIGGNGGRGGNGGAISNSGTLTITNSTLSGNATGPGWGGGSGGCCGFAGTDGKAGNGGAVSSSGTLAIANATFSGNTTGQANSAGDTLFSSPNSAMIAGSILSHSGGFDTCAGAITDGGHNISFPTLGGCPATFSTGDPKLDPAGLADNGGPTKTIALLSGSAAIDQIPSGCPAADQRGFIRPASACDIGAFEVQPANDTDGDGILNANDQCPAGAGPGTSGCPTVTRSLTLSYSKSKREFKGVLAASEPFCVSSDLVTVWKQASGDDKQIGVDEVSARGKYVVSNRGRPGRFYSTVEERVVPDVAACDSAISPNLRLR